MNFILSPLVKNALMVGSMVLAGWYIYDYIFERPVREVIIVYEKKITELNDEVVIKDEALRVTGDKLNLCYEELQELKDSRVVQELELMYRDIEDLELTGVEDEDAIFSVDNYAF